MNLPKPEHCHLCRDAEKRGFQRGYTRASHNEWPRSASIPDLHYAALVNAARILADRADGFMAQFDDRETEPLMVELDAARDLVLKIVLEAREDSLENVIPVPQKTPEGK